MALAARQAARLGLLAIAPLILVGCGPSPHPVVTHGDVAPTVSTTTSPATTTTTTMAPTTTSMKKAAASTDTEIHWDAWDWARYVPVRTTNHGSDLLILDLPGPPYKADEPCTLAIHVALTETDSQVRVRLGESRPLDRRPPPPPPSAGYACALVGVPQPITIHLARPFGGRQLVDEHTNEAVPVLDEDTLATVEWLPDGWHPGRESGTRSEGGFSWTRSFGPDRPAPTDNRCTATDAGMSLREGAARGYREAIEGEEDVHGVRATYREHDNGGSSLTWVEHEQLYVVASQVGCEGDRVAPKETMLHFARSLVVP
jgi:hypothetical protein